MDARSRISGLEGPDSLGAWTMTADPITVEMLCKAGFDFLGFDLQHGFFDFASCLRGIQLANLAKIPAIVRLSVLDLPLVPRVLDHGADGVIVAMIESVADVVAAIDASRYQPRGTRSYGGFRYGLIDQPGDPRDLIPNIYAMIETQVALDNLSAIAEVPHLAGLVVGPVDLGLAIGATFPPHADAIWQNHVLAVAGVAHSAGLVSATFAEDGREAGQWLAQGFDAVVVASDVSILSRGVRAELAHARVRPPEHSPVFDV